MKLFYAPGACSMSPHIVLEESGLPYSIEKVDLKSKRTETGVDYITINPKGMVPALQLDDGQILTEGQAIVQYLADKVPAKKLIPPVGSLERYRVAEWLSFIGAELHKQFGPLFHAGTSADYRTLAQASLLKNFGYVNQQLQGKKFLVGEQFSVADAYLFVMLSWAPHVKLDLSSLPNLGGYAAAIRQRPSVVSTLKSEGLSK